MGSRRIYGKHIMSDVTLIDVMDQNHDIFYFLVNIVIIIL